MTSGESKAFRRDINGWRAWAVVAVMLYHFKVPGFRSGFIGVDMFFVISGLLMTRIIMGGLEHRTERFSLLRFYSARARRIVPALAVMCATLLILGWKVLLPIDYKQLGNQVVMALSFASNFWFWQQTGYFAPGAEEQWLLHTWSLAVEWQFYLVLPLILMVVWRLCPRRSMVNAVVVALFLLSLGLSACITPTQRDTAFYLLPTRAWELLAGSLVYLFAHQLALSRGAARALEAVGLLLLIGSGILLDPEVSWPGWPALVPVLGTMALLTAARADSLWTRTKWVQWAGSRSYSLYLWHWPVVVAIRYWGNLADLSEAGLGLLVTMVLAEASFRYVESPVRTAPVHRSLNLAMVTQLAAVVAIAAFGAGVRLNQGVEGRFPAHIEMASRESLNRNPRIEECHHRSGRVSPSCVHGGKRVRLIIMGDSHANSLVSTALAAAPGADDGVLEWTYSGCPILRNVRKYKQPDWQCTEFIEWAMAQLETIPRDVPLVIVNRHVMYAYGNGRSLKDALPLVYFPNAPTAPMPAFLDAYQHALTDTMCHLAKSRTVYLVRPIPEMHVHVPNLARSMIWGRSPEAMVPRAEYEVDNGPFLAAQDQARQQCGVRILDPVPYLCPKDRCDGIRQGRPLYSDDDHLSEYGSRYLVPMFAQVYEQTPDHAPNDIAPVHLAALNVPPSDRFQVSSPEGLPTLSH